MAFTSAAFNLVPDDTNRAWDIFVRETTTGILERVSTGPNRQQGNNHASFWSAPSISADGNWIAFCSLASNLYPADTNATADVFLHNRKTGFTQLISIGTDTIAANGWSDTPVLSPDARYLVFTSQATNLVFNDTNNARDVFLYDSQKKTIELISLAFDGSLGNNDSGWAAISADGNRIAFASSADNLVPGDTNNTWDVFLRDRSLQTTIRVSVGSDGRQGSGASGQFGGISINSNGDRIAFETRAENFNYTDQNKSSDIYLRDLTTFRTLRISVSQEGNDTNGECIAPALSADGRFVTFTCRASNVTRNDENDAWDIFLRDTANHITTLVSGINNQSFSASGDSGIWGPPAISHNGKIMAFASASAEFNSIDTNNTWDVFTTNLEFLRIERILYEGYTDVGMPYCTPTKSKYRGCPDGYDCGGPFHGWQCGVCTDLILDAYYWGTGYSLQSALEGDLLAHPERSYLWKDMRNAHDMYLYFLYTNQLLNHTEPYQPGDIAFFDWDADGIIEHVSLVVAIKENQRPATLLTASGAIESNLNGKAFETTWKNYHDQGIKGHGRLGGTTGIFPTYYP